MNATIDRFNRLVEEFDESTGGLFDRETDLATLTTIAAVWPSCRRTLAHDLALIDVGELTPAAKAGKRVAYCEGCGGECPTGWRFCETCNGLGDASRDDWRADR